MMPAATLRQVGGAALGAGLVLGVLYTLSPLSVWCLSLLIVVSWRVSQGLSPRERQWFFALLVLAVAARLATIAGLFLFADPSQPFATLFGDEQFFKNRTVWLRNVGLGVPISKADFIYAYEDVGRSSFLYVLAYIQALVGQVPYGVHVLNAAVYVTGVLVVYRVVRAAYGGAAALIGLGLLLYLPSLFIWSISALKEPLYTLVAVGELLCALQVARARRWQHAALAITGVVAGAVALESIRRGGLLVAMVGATAGLLIGYLLTRPRALVAALVAVPIVLALALATPAVQDRLLYVVRESAVYHGGHIGSSGYSYKILDPRYYRDRRLIRSMPPREAAAYVVRSVASYVTEPVPWRSESMTMRAYLPEQIAWFVILALVPIGLVAGIRRDAMLTSLLAAQAFAVMMMVAMTSGNIGTLIRHRGLVLPYLAWLAGLGAYELVRVATPVAAPTSGRTNPHGDR